MAPRFDWERDEYPVSDDIDLATFQLLIAYEDHEIVGVFKDRRLALRPKRGGAEQVGFVDQELPFLQDALIVHNHPYGVLEPLSGDDAFVAASNDAAEIRAVCEGRRVYRLARPDGGWPEAERLRDAGDGALLSIAHENARRKKAGLDEMTLDEENNVVFGAQRSSFAELGVLYYVEGYGNE